MFTYDIFVVQLLQQLYFSKNEYKKMVKYGNNVYTDPMVSAFVSQI